MLFKCETGGLSVGTRMSHWKRQLNVIRYCSVLRIGTRMSVWPYCSTVTQRVVFRSIREYVWLTTTTVEQYRRYCAVFTLYCVTCNVSDRTVLFNCDTNGKHAGDTRGTTACVDRPLRYCNVWPYCSTVTQAADTRGTRGGHMRGILKFHNLWQCHKSYGERTITYW